MKPLLHFLVLAGIFTGWIFSQTGAWANDEATARMLKENLGQGFEVLMAKADSGDAGTQFDVGVCYEDGTSVGKNLTKAVKWYRKAADQGKIEGQYNFAACYEEGRGATRNAIEAPH